MDRTRVGGALDEAALLDRARAGDREAQGLLIGRYADDVYRVTSGVLRDHDLAQDAAQDTFVNVLRGIGSFRGQASLRTWIMRIAANAATTIGRRSTRRREQPLDAAEPVALENDAGSAAETRADAQRLEALLARLPPKQRMAVTLRIQQDLSYAAIGEIIDCSEGAARVNYHLGIRRLREMAEHERDL